MSSAKRKAAIEESATKNKRLRQDTQNKKQIASNGPDAETQKTMPKSDKPKPQSLLVKEQAAFPRGGAGLLTPLERKQISAKASRDAAREHNQSQDLFTSGKGLEDEETDQESIPEDEAESTKTKQKLSKRKSRATTKSTPKEGGIRIEGLSHKRLDIGSLVLGQITAISSRDLTIALPNNLVGYVPLTAVSRRLNKKIQGLLSDKQEDNESKKADDDDEDIALSDYFHVGQFLRVSVTSVGDEAGPSKSKTRKRIELSVESRLVNVGLQQSSLAVGCVAQATITSVEDHGLVVDLDLENETTRGFIPNKDLPTALQPSTMKVGAVLMCSITSLGSNGKIVKLSANLDKMVVLKSAPSVDAYLPGTLVEVLLTEKIETGLTGKVMGMLDVTADLVHSGSFRDKEKFASAYDIGMKVQARLLYTFPMADQRKLGFSLLENVLSLVERSSTTDGSLKPSAIVNQATVARVEPGLGVYLDLSGGNTGFAHISRLSDKKVDSVSEVSGPYKLGSQHNARILDFNPIDGLYIVSLQKKVLEQPFLRVDDVPIGEVVKGTIGRIIVGAAGIQGLIVNIAENVSGLVPQIHMSDIVLQHPEKKFREGLTVTARVLSKDIEKRQLRLTLKKTLVNSDQKLWSDYDGIEVDDSTVGTLVKVDSYGALVQFYGQVKGFLPVAEMSEAYIKDATEHFRVGQVVTVHAISVNSEDGRLTVSCRDSSTTNASRENSLADLQPGTLVNGVVFEKSQDDLLLRLEGSGAIARLTLDHVSDGSLKKRQTALSKIRVGQRLENVLILDVQAKKRMVIMCNRQSLIKAAQGGALLKSFEDLRQGATITGFVSNITTDGVFVCFAAGITGLITKRQVSVDAEDEADFGMRRLQPVTVRVLTIDYKGASPRFWLTMRDAPITTEAPQATTSVPSPVPDKAILEPVDESVHSTSDFSLGKLTKARITSVKDTQLNVELAKDVQGRIDVSEIFDTWEDIKDRKAPLRAFSTKQVLDVKILGAHDTRTHRFLPITHRSGKTTVFELTMKPSALKNTHYVGPTMADMKVGKPFVAFVNNIGQDHLWVSLSPSIRGRIRAIDVADDLSLAADLEANFPLGSALRVKVLSSDLEKDRLDLTARTGSSKQLSLDDLSAGEILPGRVTKISDRQILVQLSDHVVGAVDLIDMADDYAQADPAKFQKNEVVRVQVVRVDKPNKKVVLSTRPSKVLSSSSKVTDPEITNVAQIHMNDIVRGFVANVSDKGIFVTLGHGITAFVRVSNLSNEYLKEWKDQFQRDQLVRGKVVAVDQDSRHVQLSLKKSHLDTQYTPPQVFTDMHVGDIVTAKVVKAETFGVFLLVDNSENVRGLCHRSEMAEQRIEDATKLYSEGDVVKAKVLKVDPANRRINFSMKAKHFADDGDEQEDEEMEDNEDNVKDEDDDEESDAGMDIDFEAFAASGEKDDQEDDDTGDELEGSDISMEDGLDISEDGEDLDDIGEVEQKPETTVGGLAVGGFDWQGTSDMHQKKRSGYVSDTDDEKAASKPRKKKKRAEIQIDQTGDLDPQRPQSVDDFERLLFSEPNSSLLWLKYMAFHLDLGDVDQARQIGERALKSIPATQDAEKLDLWIALLNLENAYGDAESIESTFQRACEYNDAQELHSRLSSIYIQSGKNDKADDIYQRMLKKFKQDPKVWTNYATFLFDVVEDADKARALLPRALQTLPKFTHFDLTSKFAQLEFKTKAGLPERGRTIFEGLVNSFPKRIDLFNVLLDLELTLEDNNEQVRALFERIVSGKLKPKQGKYFFKRWLDFETKMDDQRAVEHVKVKALEFKESYGKA